MLKSLIGDRVRTTLLPLVCTAMLVTLSGQNCGTVPLPSPGGDPDGSSSSALQGTWRGTATRTGSLSGAGGTFAAQLEQETNGVELKIGAGNRPESLRIDVPWSASLPGASAMLAKGFYLPLQFPLPATGQKVTNSEVVEIGKASSCGPNGCTESPTYGRLTSEVTLREGDFNDAGLRVVCDVTASISPLDGASSKGVRQDQTIGTLETSGTVTIEAHLEGNSLAYEAGWNAVLFSAGNQAGNFETREAAQLARD